MITQKDYLEEVSESAKYKDSKTLDQLIISSFFGGFYVAIAGMFSAMISYNPDLKVNNPGINKFIQGGVFSTGLMSLVLTGSELFTGNCFIMTVGLLNRKISFWGYLKSLFISFLGNLPIIHPR